MAVLDPLNLGEVRTIVTTLAYVLLHGEATSAKVYHFDGLNWTRIQ